MLDPLQEPAGLFEGLANPVELKPGVPERRLEIGIRPALTLQGQDGPVADHEPLGGRQRAPPPPLRVMHRFRLNAVVSHADHRKGLPRAYSPRRVQFLLHTS